MDQRILLAPGDGSVGPLLRIADDTLSPGEGYGQHAHRAVDVVAVVLAGELWHRGGEAALLRAGDVGILRAGTGLEHDEVAGEGGARVLQAYLRSAEPAVAAAHEVVRAAAGWVDLGRPDARLWAGRAPAAVPPGLRVVVPASGPAVVGEDAVVPGETTVLVWQLDRARPAWAEA